MIDKNKLAKLKMTAKMAGGNIYEYTDLFALFGKHRYDNLYIDGLGVFKNSDMFNSELATIDMISYYDANIIIVKSREYFEKVNDYLYIVVDTFVALKCGKKFTFRSLSAGNKMTYAPKFDILPIVSDCHDVFIFADVVNGDETVIKALKIDGTCKQLDIDISKISSSCRLKLSKFGNKYCLVKIKEIGEVVAMLDENFDILVKDDARLNS